MIVHKRGATFTATIEITDDAGDPVDLTGSTVESAIASEVARFVLTSVVAGPLLGLITVSATAAEAQQWRLGDYDWDIAIRSSVGVAEPWPVSSNFKIRVIDSPTLRGG